MTLSPRSQQRDDTGTRRERCRMTCDKGRTQTEDVKGSWSTKGGPPLHYSYYNMGSGDTKDGSTRLEQCRSNQPD